MIENQTVKEIQRDSDFAGSIKLSKFGEEFLTHRVHSMVHRVNLRHAPNIIILHPDLWKKFMDEGTFTVTKYDDPIFFADRVERLSYQGNIMTRFTVFTSDNVEKENGEHMIIVGNISDGFRYDNKSHVSDDDGVVSLKLDLAFTPDEKGKMVYPHKLYVSED